MTRTASILALLALLAAAIPGLSATSGSALPVFPERTVRFSDGAAVADADVEVRMAVEAFVLAMSTADAEAVWTFASEEEQDAFATEDATYEAFAEAFPALVAIANATVDTTREEGDTLFVGLSLTDMGGQRYRASIGLWLDDSGTWKVISCEIGPDAPEHVAAL